MGCVVGITTLMKMTLTGHYTMVKPTHYTLDHPMTTQSEMVKLLSDLDITFI